VGGNPTDPNQGKGPLALTQDKGVVVLRASLPFGSDTKPVQEEVAQFMIRLKGGADMVSSHSRIHELAAALRQYVQEKGHFPRGTADRRETAERFIPWAPDQRISWMGD